MSCLEWPGTLPDLNLIEILWVLNARLNQKINIV